MIHHILPSCIPKRWETAILIFFGLVANYSLRINLSIAIIAMSNSTSIDGTVINWTSEEKNYVLSAFFYGYVIMQVWNLSQVTIVLTDLSRFLEEDLLNCMVQRRFWASA